MPAWLVTLLQMLPQIIAEIEAIIAAIGGGTPTPAQSARLQALADLHGAGLQAMTTHFKAAA